MEQGIKNELGPNIKYYRIRMGFTQEEFSTLLYNEGIMLDRTTLTKIENQTRGIHDFQIRVFVKVLQVEYTDLFDDISR